MVSRRRFVAWAVMGIGLVVVMAIPVVLGETASEGLLVGLSVSGGGLAFAGALWDDAICRAGRDERVAEIHYRSGYNGLLAVAATLGTAFFVAVNLDTDVHALVLWGVLMAGLVVYFGSVAWYRRRM